MGEKSEGRMENKTSPPGWRVLLAGALFLAGGCYLLWWLPHYWYRDSTFGSFVEREKARSDLRTVIVQLSVAVGLGIGAWITWRTLREQQKSTNAAQKQAAAAVDQARLAEGRQLAERFENNLERLSHTDPTVRVGAITAIAGAETQAVVLVLTSFVFERSRTRLDGKAGPPDTVRPDVQAALTVLTSNPEVEGLDLQHLCASGAVLGDATMRRAAIRDTNLEDADLRRADLSGATGDSRTDLSGANLGGTRLVDAQLAGVDMVRADLTGADLTGVDLRRANLRGADFTGATLTDADLTGTMLHEIDVTYTTSHGPEIESYMVDFSRAVMRGVDFRNAKNGPLDFVEADLTGANLGELDLSSCDFYGADLRHADLSKVSNIQDSLMHVVTYDTTTKWPSGYAPPGPTRDRDAPLPERTWDTLTPAPPKVESAPDEAPPMDG